MWAARITTGATMPELKPIVEPLAGGLVNSRDPSLLQQGELTRADNGFYPPDVQGLHVAPSRTQYASGLGAAITGLRYAAFDFVTIKSRLVAGQVTVNALSGNFNQVSLGARAQASKGLGDFNTVATKPLSTQITLATAPTVTEDIDVVYEADRVLVAQANNKYKIAKAATTAQSFSDVATITEGDSLELVPYENFQVLLNGKNPNLVLKSDGTTIPHGLQPVTAAAAVTTGSGSWGLATGFYAYWTTEYDKTNDVESDYQGPRPTVIQIPNITTKAIITRPPRVNATATHWRVYRSTKASAITAVEAAKEDLFPTGFMIGEAEIKDDGTQQTMDDGGTVTSTAARNPSALAQFERWVNDTTVNNPTQGLNASDGLYASVTGLGSGAYRPYALDLGTFGFTISALLPPINGITVTVKGKIASGGFCTVAFPQRNTAEKMVPLTTIDSSKTVGSANDTWLPTGQAWNPADFADGTFYVRVYGYVAAVIDKVFVDSVAITISYGSGQQGGTTKVFPAIVVKPFGITTAVGRNGPPPKSTTGDKFQGSIVMNDVRNESLIWYTDAGSLHAIPSVYFLPIDDNGKEVIRRISTVGEVCLVGTSSAFHRLNYLPRDVDAEFDRGRCKVAFETNHGLTGLHAAAKFTMHDNTQQLAYVSDFNVHRTEGYRTNVLTPDLNINKLVDPAQTARTLLVNNPRFYELVCYYVPLGSGTPTVPTKAIRFSYHPDHLKSGYLKMSGPCDVEARSAVRVTLRDGTKLLFTGKNDGTVQLENQGWVTAMTVQTRQMYHAGIGREWLIDEAFIHHILRGFSATSPGNIAMSLLIDKFDTATRTSSTKTTPILLYANDGSAFPERPILSQLVFREAGEAMRMLLSITSSQPIAVDSLTILAAETGRANSRP